MELIKLKPEIKVSQAMPFIEKVARQEGLTMCIDRHFNIAWRKLKVLLLICEQNGLHYWVNRDFRMAENIYRKSITYN